MALSGGVMAEQHPRRVPSNAPSAIVPPVIPVPPPLPEPKRNLITRFVTQPFATYGSSRPATVQPGREGGRAAALPRLSGYNAATTSQNAKFKTKVTAEIAALDINQERTHAILAGREILETVRISGTTCSEDLNIREALYSHDRYNATRNRDNLDIHDVKWSHGSYSNCIACAATNGKVVIYDLGRPGIETARLHEHHRQVHRVAFSPFQGSLLLSASQDGNVRLWDMRDLRSGITTISSRANFTGQSEGIRDIRWSPTDVLEFALGTDGGSVQRWDHRNPKVAKLKINAYEAGCRSVDWHPDGKHLLSAGQDRSGDKSCGILKIWDFSTDHKRQKPIRTLKTPYRVNNARWRPPCWSGDDLGRGSWQATQVITSYNEKHPVIHLWDFRRPCIPFREMYTSRTAPTDLLWHSIDSLWTVSREGEFHQTDMKYAPKTIDRRPLSTFAISPTGEIVAFSQKRTRRRTSDLDHSLQCNARPNAIRVTPKAAMPELSRSSVDDSIDDTFLSSSYQPKHHERSLSNRSTKSLASTPPSLDKESLLKFDVVLEQVKESSLPQQSALRGPLPGIGSVNAFSYLAQKYKSQPLPDEPTIDDYKNVSKVFEQNASYASRTGHHRAAQVWKDVGALLQQEVNANAKQMRSARRSKDDITPDPHLTLPPVVLPNHEGNELSKSTATNSSLTAALMESNGTESDSNMPTPLAKPHVSTTNVHTPSAPQTIPEPPQDDQLSLPPSVVSGGSAGFLKSSDGSDPTLVKPRPRRPTIDETTNWFSTNDISERKAQIKDWRPQPRTQLDFDTPTRDTRTSGVPIPPKMDRHNSDESFAMFPSSSESKHGLLLSQSINSQRERKPSMSSIPEDIHGPYESFQTNDSGSTSFSQPNEEESASGSSRDDVFNGSFDSMNLSESPLGTRALVPSPFPTGSKNDVSKNYQSRQSLKLAKTRPSKLTRSQTAAPAVQPPTKNKSKELILEDFQHTPGAANDRNYPVTAGKMLKQSFLYHTKLMPDAQQIFHLTTLLKMFLPNSRAIASHEQETMGREHLAETQRVLQAYADYCRTDIGLDGEEIHLVLTDHLAHLTRFGINPLQVEAIFIAYQEQLERCMLFTPSSVLRNLLYPSLGAFRENLLEKSGIGLMCLKCGKLVSSTTGKCEKCGKQPDMCPICWQKYSPYVLTKRARKLNDASKPAMSISADGRLTFTSRPVSSPPATKGSRPSSSGSDTAIIQPSPPTLYQFCLTCGHGAHAACLQTQQKSVPELGGRCPTAGCGCPCIPGLYRDQTIKKAEEEKARRNAGTVKGDRAKVKESGAVKGARGLLSRSEGGEEGKRVRIADQPTRGKT